MEFFDKLQVEYNNLTNSGKKIADFLIKEKEAFMNMTAIEIGKSSKTSAAAVIRFCKHMEYGSLDELKRAIARNLSINVTTKDLNTIFEEDDSIDILMQKIYNNSKLSLKKTKQLFDVKAIMQTVTWMKEASAIYIYAIGASSLAAYDLQQKLIRIAVPCMYQFDPHINLSYAANIKPHDFVIVFSYSGETKEVLLAAKKAKENGAKVTAITKLGTTSLSEIADITLFLHNDEQRLRVGAISSRYSQALYVDLLYLCLIQKDFERVSSCLYETSMLVDKLLK